MSNKLYFITIFLFIGCITAWADEKKEIRFAVPDEYVTRFPDKKGLVAVFGVVDYIYKAAGYRVKVVPRPSQRAARSTLDYQADIYLGSRVEALAQSDKLIISELPAIVAPILLYYRKKAGWRPSWPPDKYFLTLTGKSVLAVRYFRDKYGLNVTLSPNFTVASKMVEMARADYFIDTIAGFVELLDGSRPKLDPALAITTLFYEPIHLIARNDKMGSTLLEVWNNAQINLLQQGKYRSIYYQSRQASEQWPMIERLITTLQSSHPDLNIPKQ